MKECYYIQKLRDNKIKVTPKRKEIINIFLNEKCFLDPEQIFIKMKENFDSVSFPSIYRNLETMSQIGILTEIHKPDRKLYYALCKAIHGAHHHHIVCIKCGKTEEFYDCIFDEKKEINGFKIITHSLQLDGICPKCREQYPL